MTIVKMVLTVFIFFILLNSIACDQSENSSSAQDSESTNIEKNRGIPVEVMVLTSQDVQNNLSLSGILNPVHSVDIIAEVSGKVEKINKKLGDKVSDKDILALIDDNIPLSNYKQAKSQVLSAENNLKIAHLNLLSDEELYNSGDISKLEYENSVLAVKTAEANHLSALATLSLMEKSYSDTRITSPISGFISRKYIDLGTMVTPNMALYRVVDISSLKVEIGIPQEMIAKVESGTKANIEISALSNEIFKGYVRYISPQADERTGSFSVEIHVKNSVDRKIMAGMTAKVEILLSSKLNQLVVPDHAVISRNDSNFVYLVKDNQAWLRPIGLGSTFENLMAVENGVANGDTIVVVGLKNLNDGSSVWIESLQ
jgi:RND family efflux transporter MFP subunit